MNDHALDHDAVRDMIAMAALEALSPRERASLEAHVSTCAECARDLASMRDGAAALAAALPPRPIATERSAKLRARLLARAAADRGGVTPITPIAATTRARASGARWLAAAALLLAATAALYGAREHASARTLAADVSRLRDTAGTMRQRLADQQAILAALTGPSVRVIDVAAASARQPYARMFWDQPTNRWTFVAYNLPATASGHTYQLWLITRDQKKVSAGTFEPSVNGSAFIRATYPLAPDSLQAIAVTSEPAGGSLQPTTTPFLVGAARGN